MLVLDVGSFTLPHRPPHWDETAFRNDSFEMHFVRTKAELAAFAACLSDADLIVDLNTAHGHSRWNLPVLRAIARSGTPSLVISVNAYPGYQGTDAAPDRFGGGSAGF